MDVNLEELLEDKELKIANAVLINVEDIDFSEEVRKYCEMNTCGKYGTNWACPPGVGPVSELKNKAQSYQKGLLVQTVHPLKNSFDWKGMMAGGREHERVLRSLLTLFKEKYGLSDILLLGAGCCTLCEKCTYNEGEPCRFPDNSLASIEAFGIDVVRLVKSYNIPYNNGPGTVSYVGVVLFNEN